MTASDLDDIPLSLLRDRKGPKDSEKTLDGSLQESEETTLSRQAANSSLFNNFFDTCLHAESYTCVWENF